MIEYIKTDCSLNSKIVIEFENQTYTGRLISIDDKLLRIETENGISALTAKKLENLIDYHVIVEDDKIVNDITGKVVETEIEPQIQKQESSILIVEPKLLVEFSNEYYNIELKFPANNFTLLVPKVDRYSCDEETYEISQQIQRVQSKYIHAKKLNVEKNRFEKLQEIESLLKTLLSNHYFNDYLRYNIAFINYELDNIDKAISILTQTPNIETKRDTLLFISFLHFKNNNHPRSLFYFNQYFKLSDKTTTDFYFLLKLIEITKAFFLLNGIQINFTEIQECYLATLNWLKIFDFKDEYLKQIQNFNENQAQYNELIENNIKLLQSLTDENTIQELDGLSKSKTYKGYFNSVLIGQDVMPDFEAKFPNVFAVTERERLSYLKKEDAIALIEKPILFINKQGKDESRFIGNAVDKIIDYTAGNPYYIQIFCDRLVSYLNDKKSIRATIVSVNEVAQSLIKGKAALTEKEFDNLLTAGDADLEANPVEYTFEVLKNIADASENLGSCTKQAIVERLTNEKIIEKLDDIIQDLQRRQVITSNDGYFRLQVQLFHKWLINR